MEISDVRRRIRGTIERARRDAAARRERSDAASRDYERFLNDRAAPVFHQLASALIAEGHRFKVFTPAGSVRLAAERSTEEFIEIALDTSQDPPLVVVRTSRGRGRRQVTSERPLRDGTAIGDLTEDDVLGGVLEELAPFVER